MMRQVIDDGRNAVRGLRAHASQSLDLEQAFSQVWREMDEHGQTGFRVVVEGPPIPLHPLLRDDVYRIGREALINSFRHAHAHHIEVQLKYSPNELCIVVRDDGGVIDPHVLQGGKEGHWGLSGMGERADRIGARLSLSSSPTAGTDLQLFIPARTAYLGQSKRRLKWFTNSVSMKQK
jgi:signal transduction histidine kinase